MLSAWFASNLLMLHAKKTQAMILGNRFQEPVVHIGDFVIFLKEIIFPSNSHDSRHNLQKSQGLKKKPVFNANDRFLPFGLNEIFVQMLEAGVIQGNEILV